MTELVKAYLAEITSGNSPRELEKTKVDVQFNPTSLRVQISNRTAGGQQAGAQARQRPGTGEMQVSFDLVFDTADEGTTGEGVSVLQRTQSVERFVRPRSPRAGQEAPPRVVFVWGDFLVQGTMESANIDLDLFDAKGVPLRAKVAVSIKGQDPRWAYTPAPAAPEGGNAGRRNGGTSLPPGAPGTQGNGLAPERIVQAMPGESLAQLAARSGFDPAAWRALADGLANPLNLSLGQEVAMPPSGASQAAAGGLATQGSDPATTAASLPLVAPTQAASGGAGSSATPGRPAEADPVRQGHAVAHQGGLQGAIAKVKGAAHQQAAVTSLAAFGLGAAATADTDDRPWGMGVPLRPKFRGRTWAAQDDGPSLATVPARRAARRAGCDCGCHTCRCKH